MDLSRVSRITLALALVAVGAGAAVVGGVAWRKARRPLVTFRTTSERPQIHFLEDGKLLESQLGEIADGDFTLTMTFEDAKKVQTGELDPNAAFMQGRMKVSGNMAKLMSLLPLTNSPEYRALQEQIREITEY